MYMFCHFSLAIVLYVLLRFTNSDYLFGIFKLFLHVGYFPTVLKKFISESETGKCDLKDDIDTTLSINYILTSVANEVFDSFYTNIQEDENVKEEIRDEE